MTSNVEELTLRYRFLFSIVAAFVPAIATANGLTDLHATLTRLGATTPVRGSVEMSSVTKTEDKSVDGKMSVRFDSSSSGLHIIYPPSMLAQATEEARAEARDPERQTPLRNGVGRVRPLHIAELVDGATALDVLLESAQFVETRQATFGGRPARQVVMKVQPKISKSDAKHLKKLDGMLYVWIGEDGVPLAAEKSSNMKVSFLLISIEGINKESWTYTRTGDRLLVTHYEKSEQSDGLGQHTTTRTVEAVKLD